MTEFQMDEIMNNYRIEDLYDSKHYWDPSFTEKL